MLKESSTLGFKSNSLQTAFV